LLLRVFVGIGSLKGKYISGQGTLFCIYGFISDFSKMLGIWKKDMKKHMRKRI